MRQVKGHVCFIHSHQNVLFEKQTFRLLCGSPHQRTRTKNTQTNLYKTLQKIAAVQHFKIGWELGVHVHPLLGGCVQPVDHTRAVACHVLGSGGGADFSCTMPPKHSIDGTQSWSQ